MHVKRILAASILMISLAGGTAYGQGIITGSLNGTITDPSGAVVPNATVTVTNNGTSIAFSAKTNSKGELDVENLPVGTYTVTVTGQGFAPLKVSGVVVNGGAASSLGTQKLSLTASEDVTVSTGQALLESTQAQLTTTIDSQEITDLPTGGGLDRLVLLVPGVVRTLGNNYANTNGTGLSSNGLRGRSNNFEIDGQSNNDNSVSGPQFFFRNEFALDQLIVITNNFGAQYGRNAGEVINYLTKSGSNVFHGSAFENYLGSWGSSLLPSQKNVAFGYCYPGATSCISPVVPRVTANEWGGTLGGPILKDKLFGFGAVLYRKVTNGASPSTSSSLTPTPNGITQLATIFPNNGLVGTLKNEGPWSVKAGNPQVTQGSTVNIPVCAQASASACPAGSPTAEFGTITRFLPSYSQDQEIIGRLDYQATNRDRIYVRYMYQNAPTLVSGGTVSSGAYYDTSDVVYSTAASVNHTFSPHWLNSLTYSFQQSKLTFGNGGYPTCNDSNIASCPANIAISGTSYSKSNAGPTATDIVTLSSIGFGPATNIPQGRIVKVTQVQDNATYSIGRHAITFGGEFDYQNSPNTFLPNTSGAFSFQSFSYGLVGNTTLTLANGSPNIPFKEPDFAGYFQDDWRVTPELTLNLGIRWEFFKQGINVLNSLSTANQTGKNPIWLTSLPLSQTTFPYIPNTYKNYQPRVGFAYSPAYAKGFVARGGFAINFDPAFYNIFLNSYTAAPVVNTGVIACDGVTVACVPTGGAYNAAVHTQDDKYNPTGVNPGTKVQTDVTPNFSNPYVLNYTLGIQQQVNRFAVVEVRYVGNHAVKQFQSFNGNPSVNIAPPAASVPTTQNYQTLAQAFPTMFPASSYCTTPGAVGLGHVNCNKTYVTTRGNTSFSIYNALQTQIKTANYHGVTGSVAYTWSRTIDNTSEVYSGGTSGGNTLAIAQNPFNIDQPERGVSGDSYPNVVAVALDYRLPAYKEQKGIIGHLLGGYSLNTIYTHNSGQPYTPYQPSKISGGPAVSKIPTANQGQALYSFGDYYYNTGVLGADSSRPILVNPSAPAGTVAINGGPGVGYLDFNTGASVSRTTDKWLINNQYEAEALGNPYPGSGRNILRGEAVDELDASIFKTVKLTERVNMQMRILVYNLPNHVYLGNPDSVITDAANTHTTTTDVVNGATVQGIPFHSFENYSYNGGSAVGTAFGKGGRNVQLGANITF
jgi:hypothetical protein